MAPTGTGPKSRVIRSSTATPASVHQSFPDSRVGSTPKSSPTVPLTSPYAVAVSADGSSVYVTSGATDDGAVAQFDTGVAGALTPKTPASVPAAGGPAALAVTPAVPRPVPVSITQCKNGGWRNFPGFKNQGQCVSFVATGGKKQP